MTRDPDQDGADRQAEPGPEVTPDLFLAWRSPRRGTANPERMDNPVWAWLVRSRLDAHSANARFDGPPSAEAGPCWCCDRFGQSATRLPDGREVLVAGEHEDHYDPDFHIYNDVIVLDPGGGVAIHGYPTDVFPPTDFHSATLVGDGIVLVGSLGYRKERRPGATQVLRLDLRTWSMRTLPTTGTPPGWIHGHEATLADGGRSLLVSGGKVFTGGEDAVLLENLDDWRLDLDDLRWHRLTERRWPRWELRRLDRGPGVLWEMRASRADDEIRRRYGDPPAPEGGEATSPLLRPLARASDPELLDALYRPAVAHVVLPEREDEHNVYRFEVDGVVVRYVEDYASVVMTVEGTLPPETIERLVADARANLSRLEGVPWVAIRR